MRICTDNGISNPPLGPWKTRAMTLMLVQSWVTLSVHLDMHLSKSGTCLLCFAVFTPFHLLPPSAARSHLSSLHMQPINAKSPVQNSLDTKFQIVPVSTLLIVACTEGRTDSHYAGGTHISTTPSTSPGLSLFALL